MAEYVWPSAAAVVLLGLALWSYTRCRDRRLRALDAFVAVESPLRRRRDAAADLAMIVRTFRPQDSERFALLQEQRLRAVEADSAPLAERRVVEARYTNRLQALLEVAGADKLLKSHSGACAAADRLRAIQVELAEAIDRYHGLAAEYRRRAARFPNNVVLHVLDLPTPEEFDIGLTVKA